MAHQMLSIIPCVAVHEFTSRLWMQGIKKHGKISIIMMGVCEYDPVGKKRKSVGK